MLAVTDNNDCLVVDQLLSAWDIGRTAAIWEMNVPGSVVAHFTRCTDKNGNETVVHASAQPKRERYCRFPFVDEINFDDALIDCIIFDDDQRNARSRTKVAAVDRAEYLAVWDEALEKGENPQEYVQLNSKRFMRKLDNPNCTIQSRSELERLYSEAVSEEAGRATKIKISGQVGHLYRPKQRYSQLIHEGVGAFSGNAMSTSKLWVHLEPGFYFLRGWFSPERAARCFRPKSFARA